MSRPDDLGVMPKEDFEDLQTYLDRFECAWKEAIQHNRTPPKLGDYLPALDSPFLVEVLHEFVKTDLEYRWNQGRTPDLESYLHDHKELGTTDTVTPGLIFEEYRIRLKNGFKVKVDDYQNRFPKQFSDFKKLVETNNSARPTPAPSEITQAYPSASTPQTPGPSAVTAVLDFQPGAVIHSYEIMEDLGEGGFGEVWKARTQSTGKCFAIKRSKNRVSAPDVQRILKGLESLRDLNHPFLLLAHDWFEHGRRLCIVMDLATGGNVEERMKVCKKEGLPGIPVQELLDYFDGLAKALDYLHSRNIQHRDIKASNILLVEGIAKLADFDLAKQMSDECDVTHTMGGTPAFQAPEMFDGEVVKGKSDQYCFAYTYCQLRLGRLPFKCKNPLELQIAHQREKPNLEPIPAAEQEVLLKALEKNPEDRFDTCVEFVRELKQAVQSDTEFKPLRKPATSPALRRPKTIEKGPIGSEEQAGHTEVGKTVAGQPGKPSAKDSKKPTKPPTKEIKTPPKMTVPPAAAKQTEPVAEGKADDGGTLTGDMFASVPGRMDTNKPAKKPETRERVRRPVEADDEAHPGRVVHPGKAHWVGAETHAAPSRGRAVKFLLIILCLGGAAALGLLLIPKGKRDVGDGASKGESVKNIPAAFAFAHFKDKICRQCELGTAYSTVMQEICDEQRLQAGERRELESYVCDELTNAVTKSEDKVKALKDVQVAAVHRILTQDQRQHDQHTVARVTQLARLANAIDLYDDKATPNLEAAKQELKAIKKGDLPGEALQGEYTALGALVDARLPGADGDSAADQLVRTITDEGTYIAQRRLGEMWKLLEGLEHGRNLLTIEHIGKLETAKATGPGYFSRIAGNFIEWQVRTDVEAPKADQWKQRAALCGKSDQTVWVVACNVESIVYSGNTAELQSALAALKDKQRSADLDKVAQAYAAYVSALAASKKKPADDPAAPLLASKELLPSLPGAFRLASAADILTSSAKAKCSSPFNFPDRQAASSAYEQLRLARDIIAQGMALNDDLRIHLVLAAAAAGKHDSADRMLAETLLKDKSFILKPEFRAAQYPLLLASADFQEDALAKFQAYADITATVGHEKEQPQTPLYKSFVESLGQDRLPPIESAVLSRDVLQKGIELGKSLMQKQALPAASEKRLGRLMALQARAFLRDKIRQPIPDEAFDHYCQALMLDPANVDVLGELLTTREEWNKLASAFESVDALGKAVDQLRKATKINGDRNRDFSKGAISLAADLDCFSAKKAILGWQKVDNKVAELNKRIGKDPTIESGIVVLKHSTIIGSTNDPDVVVAKTKPEELERVLKYAANDYIKMWAQNCLALEKSHNEQFEQALSNFELGLEAANKLIRDDGGFKELRQRRNQLECADWNSLWGYYALASQVYVRVAKQSKSGKDEKRLDKFIQLLDFAVQNIGLAIEPAHAEGLQKAKKDLEDLKTAIPKKKS
jgi:serine/threonine protein kinase